MEYEKTKLKTLNDLVPHCYDGYEEQELRNAAIEHCKDIKTKIIVLVNQRKRGDLTASTNILLLQSKIDWIKMFFNITEEELK